jgi:L-2-hydroxyglutarate oxidase LhgO
MNPSLLEYDYNGIRPKLSGPRASAIRDFLIAPLAHAHARARAVSNTARGQRQRGLSAAAAAAAGRNVEGGAAVAAAPSATNGFVNLVGIESPGLTSSLAIAKYVVGDVLGLKTEGN